MPAPLSSDPVLEYFQRHEEELLAVLEKLVSLDTPTGDADLVAAFVRHYRDLVEDVGVAVEEIPGPAGPHLFAEKLAAKETRSPIVLVGHSDTVWPRGEVERRPPRIEDGRLYGPGVYDMRAGLCLIVGALRYLDHAGVELACRLQLFVSADEEEGSFTAHPHMERLISPGAIALVPEPPGADGSIKGERKGVGQYRVELRGREAHAGVDPDAGASAVHEMARRILEVRKYVDPSKGVTVNVGKAGGGTAANVVAGRASLTIDVRFDHLTDGEEVNRKILSLEAGDPRVALTVKGGIIFPPLEATERNRPLCARAVEIAKAMGLEIGVGKSGGGSDGSFLSAFGLGVVDGLGVEGAGAHALDEHIRVDRLAVRAAYFTRLILALASESRMG